MLNFSPIWRTSFAFRNVKNARTTVPRNGDSKKWRTFDRSTRKRHKYHQCVCCSAFAFERMLFCNFLKIWIFIFMQQKHAHQLNCRAFGNISICYKSSWTRKLLRPSEFTFETKKWIKLWHCWWFVVLKLEKKNFRRPHYIHNSHLLLLLLCCNSKEFIVVCSTTSW